MVKPGEIDDDLWVRNESLLPGHRPGTRGPIPLNDRRCLQGILFVLYSGINWKHLPIELGSGSGTTCWRRFRRWCEAEVWDRLHRMLLSELHALGEIDWSAVCLDGSHVRAKKGRPGSKHHVACDPTGIPLAVLTTAGNVPDIKAAPDLVDAIGPVAGRIGHPRRRPDTILADGGYDSAAFRSGCAPGGSPRSFHGAAGRGSSGWARSAGWSSTPSRICTSSNADTCSCIRSSSKSLPHSSAGDA